MNVENFNLQLDPNWCRSSHLLSLERTPDSDRPTQNQIKQVLFSLNDFSEQGYPRYICVYSVKDLADKKQKHIQDAFGQQQYKEVLLPQWSKPQRPLQAELVADRTQTPLHSACNRAAQRLSWNSTMSVNSHTEEKCIHPARATGVRY